MRRIALEPRPDWRRKVEARGLSWHTGSGGQPYWDESACWVFTAGEIDALEAAIAELYGLYEAAVTALVAQDRLAAFGYGPAAAALIARSWAQRGRQGALYARFDLAYDGHDLKLLELNGDTPTSLVEASVVQWWWLEERFPDGDQFNSIHESLVAALRRQARTDGLGDGLHLTCVRPHAEDEGTVDYLAACAAEAGLAPTVLGLEDIGWRTGDAPGRFVDLQDQDIRRLFKLAPWEWLLADRFGERLADQVLAGRLRLIEPAWKMLASDKRLLAVLWDMFPGHPLLLPASLSRATAEGWGAYVRKPATGREGANVRIVSGGLTVDQARGDYGDDPVVYQGLARLAQGAGGYAVLGGWIVDGAPVGLGIRESAGPITSNTARFLPHYFEP